MEDKPNNTTDHPKGSLKHFVAPLNPNTPQDAAQIDTYQPRTGAPSLQELYPQPKTYDQREQDNIRRQERQAARRPKLPALVGALVTSLIFGASLLLTKNLEQIWSGGLTGVALSFVITICLVGCIYLAAMYLRKVFYAYDKRPIFFTAPYLVVVFLLLGGALSGWLSPLTGGEWLVVATTVTHFVLTAGLLLIIVRH